MGCANWVMDYECHSEICLGFVFAMIVQDSAELKLAARLEFEPARLDSEFGEIELDSARL